MDEDTAEGRSRRISRRGRGAMAFSGVSVSDSTTSEGVGATATDDHELNQQVERLADLPIRQTVAPQQGALAGNPSEDFNPSDRLRQVRQRASTYEKEYRLGLLHRLLMRRVPMDEIAAQLGISISQVYRDRDELKRKLREDARSLNIEEIIGDSKGYYDEVAAMSMRAASSASLPMPMRLAAMRTALAAKNDEHRFFQATGVYDVLRFRLSKDSAGGSDVRTLMENTERILRGEAPEFSNQTRPDSGDQEEIDL